MIRTLLAAAALFSATAAMAAPVGEPKPAKTVVDPDKQRCKQITPTDSLIPTRVCHTNAEWAAQARQGRADAEQYRNVMASSRSGN